MGRPKIFDEKTLSLTIVIGKKLKQRFHKHCIEHGESMSLLIRGFIENFLESKKRNDMEG